ncbi:MAG: leucine-rich repeat protein [Spirochaetaceae bacterium]|nr:leucine-rich repeat protein [Spirochaetaceae bacterium]
MKRTGFFVSAIFALVCVLAVFSCSNMLEDLRRARASANEEEGATTTTTADTPQPAGTPVVTTPPEQIPLTLEAVAANTTVTFTNKASGVVKYKVNDGDIQTIASNDSAAIQLSAAGDKVSFFGDNAKYGAVGSSDNSSNIACDEECYVYGNIMSLIKKEGFENERTLTAEYAFANLFSNNANIKNKPGTEMLLPATTLAAHCYQRMFYGCASLETVPEDMLPATNLAEDCYNGMFSGCTSLETVPEDMLPATNLADYCYNGMFYGCTSLTSAPELPAETLAEYCYGGMFYGCASLTGAPELPAETLAYGCYTFMFKNCTSLNTVTCLATDISATNCVMDWLRGVPNDGTFYCNSLTDWSRDSNGIPSSWTTHTLPTTPLTLEAVYADTTVTFTNKAAGSVTYIIKGGATGEISSGQEKSITLSAHQKVSFYGDNAKYGASSSSDSSNIGCDEECYVYGNIMSLIKSEGFENERTLTAPYTFACLFYDNANIKNKPGTEMLLPATTLAYYCYGSMFRSCTSLSSAPELPATNLAESCYISMFQGCASLTIAPELPATTLAAHCYKRMFETCSGLNIATCLATDISATNCVYNWLPNTLGTFYRNPSVSDSFWAGKVPNTWNVLPYQQP